MELSPLAPIGKSCSSPSTMVSNPGVITGLGLTATVSTSRVDSGEVRAPDVVATDGNAVTVIFEVAGLDVDAVRLKVERGDVGFVVVWAGVGCDVFLRVTFEVRRPKRFEIDTSVDDRVGTLVGFVGDTDLDDSLDLRVVCVDLEDRVKE